MVRRTLLVVALAAAAVTLPAQQSWEGLATVGRFGRFPAGLYAASNLVSPNSLVSVRNLETGASERLIITDGVDEPGVFLVLSPEAATLLGITGSGATRVRLTTIATDSPPVNAGSETPFHPDPDINPAAGVSVEDELAAVPELPVSEVPDKPGPDEAVTPELPVVPPEPSEEMARVEETEPVATVTEPSLDIHDDIGEPQETVAAEETTPSARSGIGAGIARTRVGQAQETFERPDTTPESERPEPADPALEIAEPAVAPEETASVGLDSPTAEPDEFPEVVFQPEPPAVEAPLARLDEQTGDSPAIEDEPEAAAVDTGPNPIQEAIESALNRIPSRDYFPPAVGDDGDLGFASLPVPDDGVVVPTRLAEASPPAVDRPELAGLAPLQAVVRPLPGDLAVASIPPEDVPEFAIEWLDAPSDVVSAGELPVAVAAEEEQAELSDVGRSFPIVAEVDAPLAEATPAPEERPDPELLEAVDAPGGEVRAALAEARVGTEEEAELSDIGRSFPIVAEVDVPLAEATPDGPETPDESLAGVTPDPAAEVAAITPEPSTEIDAEDFAEVNIESPAEIPDDAVLTLEPADFRPPEVPSADEESLIDRESPEEAPDVEVAEVSEPEVAAAVEVAEPTEDDGEIGAPAATEVPDEVIEPSPAEVAVAPPDPIDFASVPVVRDISDTNYYLQIGAYSMPDTAQVAVDALGATYPMAVMPIESRGATVYRVLVGPLEQDETGTLLLFLRAKGYRETFIRSGTEL